MIPDAECVRVVAEALSCLDLGSFVIKLNHRCLLDGIFAACGVPQDKFRSVCSSVDKLDKSPWEEVRKEIVEEKQLDGAIADKIGEYVSKRGDARLVEELRNDQVLMKQASAKQGLEAMELLLKYCDIYRISDKVLFDLSLARGLDYYTGLIYEAVLTCNYLQTHSFIAVFQISMFSPKFQHFFVSFPFEFTADNCEVGSLAGGGRYDNLVGMFDTKKKTVPCVGVSLGVERIFSVLESRLANKGEKTRTTEVQVYVATAQKNLHEERMRLLTDLWEAGIKAEQSYKKSPKILAQLQHCEDSGIPYAIIIGEGELARGEVTLREVKTRVERAIPRASLIEQLRETLATNS